MTGIHSAPQRAKRVFRGDIWYADLSPVVGSEQGGSRPVLVLQNDIGNKHSPTVIVCALTTQEDKPNLPVHVELTQVDSTLDYDSIVLLEQIRTIDKRRLINWIAHAQPGVMERVDRALKISLGLLPVL